MKVIEESENRILLEIDEDFGVLNLLRKTLCRVDGVILAAHRRENFYKSPLLVIHSKNPREALKKASNLLLKECVELRKKIEKF